MNPIPPPAPADGQTRSKSILPALAALAGPGAARPSRGIVRRLLLAVLVTAGLSAAAVILSFNRQQQQERLRLQAVAEQKVQQLAAWLHERQADAQMVQAGAEATALLQRWRGGDLSSRDSLLQRLQTLRAMTPFAAAELLDEAGQPLWSSSATAPAAAAELLAKRQLAARQRQVLRQGPYRDGSGRLRTDFLVPLATAELASGQPAPLLVMQLDEARYLPAGLLDWPVPSASGEVVLARRDGDAVLFLSALRHEPNAALRLRRPVTDPALPALQLLETLPDTAQAVDGPDYRGASTFGVGRRVPGTDWILLAKMDRSEIYGPALREALWITLAGALALFVAASGLYLARQRHQLAQAELARQAQAERLQALNLLANIADSSVDAMFAKDAEGRYLLMNQAAGRIVGHAPQAVVGLDDSALFGPDQAARIIEVDRQILSQGRLITAEEQFETADGVRHYLVTKGPLRDAAGAIIGLLGVSRDITPLKQAEAALRRANRALLTSRECGQAVMHAHDEADMLSAVCRIIVHTGGWRMAWVALVQDDAARTVLPVAQAGLEAGQLASSIGLSWAADAPGQGPTVTAIRSRQPVLERSLPQDDADAPWRDAALRLGVASSAAAPLLTEAGDCIGALTLCDTEAGAFDDDDLRLVSELASDLAHGIRSLRERGARLQAERLLREQMDRLAESQRIAHVGSWQIDCTTHELGCSGETLRLHGVAHSDATAEPGPSQAGVQAIGLDAGLAHLPAPDRQAVHAWLARLQAGEDAGELDYRVELPGGTRRITARGSLLRTPAGEPWRLVGTVQDVTAAREAESERLSQETRYRGLFASNPHPMWVYDRQTLGFVEVNDAAIAKYGYSREEFLALRIDQLNAVVGPGAAPQPIEPIEAAAGEPGFGRHRLKSGALIDVQIESHSLIFGGRQAVVVVAFDVTAQRMAEASLRLQARRAEALLKLPELAEGHDETDFMQLALDIAEDLTGSHIAFIHLVNANGQSIELVTWSRRTLESFCKATHDRHYPVSEAGIWADALRQRKPVVFNDYAAYPHKHGLPEGHAVLDRLISVPVIESGKVVMLTGVGGKASDYTEIDVETMLLISSETWRLVQRRRAAAALAQSEQSYRALTEKVPAIIYRAALDEESATTYISPAVSSLGWTPEQWLANPGLWASALHPEDHDRVLAALQQAKRSHGALDVQYRLRTRDGQWRHIRDQAHLVSGADGQPLCLQGLMLDVTRHVQAEAELRKLSQAVEQSPNSIVITNLQGEIEYVNQAFLDNSGYCREEVLGHNPRMLKAHDVRPGERDAMWAELAAGRAWRGEFRNQRKDGSTYIELAHIAPLRQADGRITHYVGVKEDITEKTQIALELERHRQHLEALVEVRTRQLAQASQRAEAASRAKSAFLANMSHEIRTPMNAIIGLSYLLQSEPLAPQQAQRLAKIDTAALHLLSLINGILDLSKIEAGKLMLEPADFPLDSVLDAVQGLIADRAAAKGVAVQVRAEGVPAWLHGDAMRLRQALLNYADNALKFTEHGSITLGARLLQEDEQGGLLLRLEVQDTGIGIAAEDQPRLFQAFEQADASTTRRYGGTGLGLALTQRLAGLMGGEAGVQSQAGVGSTFWFTARLRRGQAGTGGAALAELPAVADAAQALRQHAGGSSVLVAEDDPVNREVTTELLRAAGMLVGLAIDGRQALQMASAGHYDLLLMDVQMPTLDGFEATRLLRAAPIHATLPILAMTANAFEEDRRACLEAGMNDFVPKPVDPRLLYAALMRWLPPRAATAQPPSAGAQAVATPGAGHAAALQALRTVAGLDFERGLATLRGDLGTYLHMLQMLAEHHAADAGELAEHLRQGRLLDAQQLAHRLKGAAGALGAARLQGAASLLEQSLRDQRPAASGWPLSQALADTSERLFQDLAALPVLAGPAPPPKADTTAALAVLAELEPLLAHDDTAAGEVFENHRRMLADTLGASALALGRQIEAFDFPAALATLRQLRVSSKV